MMSEAFWNLLNLVLAMMTMKIASRLLVMHLVIVVGNWLWACPRKRMTVPVNVWLDLSEFLSAKSISDSCEVQSPYKLGHGNENG